MWRALVAALLLLADSAAEKMPTSAEKNRNSGENVQSSGEEVDTDNESDGAPFAIVVEHVDGWRCGGSLVSLRTAMTSAACARGRGAAPAAELWAIAAAAAVAPKRFTDGMRHITRIATAGGINEDIAEAGRGSEWLGAVLDIVVMELEAPFGTAAQARPILMATASGYCEPRFACVVVRWLLASSPTRATRLRMRIMDVTLAPSETCAAAQKHWAAVRDHVFCLQGAELCSTDWGSGVVCGGKLCAVLSRSAGGAGGAGGEGGAEQCGHTHAAQSIARWRRFLHCAHTLRACGSGECAEFCTERRLWDTETATQMKNAPQNIKKPTPALPAASTTSDEADTDVDITTTAVTIVAVTTTMNPATTTTETSETSLLFERTSRTTNYDANTSLTIPRSWHQTTPTRTPLVARRRAGGSAARTRVTTGSSASAMPLVFTTADPDLSPRPSLDWEPNRADFKAGEYGDNAAEYGGWEVPGRPGTHVPPTRTIESTRQTLRLLAATQSAVATPHTNRTQLRARASSDSATASATPANILFLDFTLILLSLLRI